MMFESIWTATVCLGALLYTFRPWHVLSRGDNAYLLDVANELLPESLEVARVSLASVVEAVGE